MLICVLGYAQTEATIGLKKFDSPSSPFIETYISIFSGSVKYIPTQAEVGDMVLFVNKASIEVKIENEDYLIMPQSAILILIRDDLDSLAE